MAQPTPITYASTFSNDYRIYVSVQPGAYNSTYNYTPVTVQLVADAQNGMWFNGWQCTGYLNITYLNSAGVSTALNWSESTTTQRSLSGAGGYYTARTATFNAYHAPNGAGSFSVAASYGMVNQSQSYSMPQRTIATQTYSLGDYTRLPSTPGVQSHTRSGNASTVNVTSGTATFYGSGGYYQWMWSYDNANWNGPYNLDGSRNGSASVTNTSPVYVVTRAVDSEGVSGWSNVYGNSVTAGVPTAPQAINAVRSARNVAINITGSASDGGSPITGYMVAYNDGSGWSTPVAMSGTDYTYTNLPAAKTYTFRVYAENSAGTSAYATTATGIYVAAGGKRWTGSAFASTTTAKRWNGSAWTDITNAKRWNGSSWIDLS